MHKILETTDEHDDSRVSFDANLILEEIYDQFEENALKELAEEVAKQQLHELQMFESASSKIQKEILEAFILQNSKEVVLDSLKTYKEHEDLASAINN